MLQPPLLHIQCSRAYDSATRIYSVMQGPLTLMHRVRSHSLKGKSKIEMKSTYYKFNGIGDITSIV